MRRTFLIFLTGIAAVLFSAGTARAAGIRFEFQAPTLDSPQYTVRATFAVEKAPFRFSGLAFQNRVFEPREWPVYRDGRPVDLGKDLVPGTYEIVLRHAWRSNASYSGYYLYVQDEGKGVERIDMEGKAPAVGGIPMGAEEGFFVPFVVTEDAGIERKGEIVYLTLTAATAEIEPAKLAVFDGDKRLPIQVIEAKGSLPPESQKPTHPETVTVRMALAIDAALGENKLLRVFQCPPGSLPPDACTLSGEGLGKTAKNARLSLQLHPQSGQIYTIEDVAAGIKLTNKAGVIHWNPDVFIPGIAWDHSFDWNPPASFEEKNGPLVYLNTRKGPMPHVREVFLEVKYTLEKDAPYFLAETRMRVDKDLGVVALRNDEMVLFKELFDTIVYKDVKGEVVERPLRELPGRPYGLAHIASPDAPWVGLLNKKAGFGFFSLRLASSASNLDPGGLFMHRPGTYFYAPSDGDYVYWVRPWLYTWGEFATSQLLTALPAGSVFYEKNAYLLSRWDGTTPGALDALLRRLLHPLRIF